MASILVKDGGSIGNMKMLCSFSAEAAISSTADGLIPQITVTVLPDGVCCVTSLCIFPAL